MSSVNVVVAAGEPREDLILGAEALAQRLRLPLAGDEGLNGINFNELPRGAADFILTLTGSRLELRAHGAGRARPLWVDFVGGPTGFRRIAVGGRKQPLARAVGIKGVPPTVVDATAGLCRDAFLLAALGCQVVALERSPVLHALAADGLSRATESGVAKVISIVERIRLVQCDAREWLQGAGAKVNDVVYLDPMYPPSHKSAEVRREMRALRAIVGSDPDSADLLATARSAAGRVVVKRLRHSPPLGPAASHTVSGTRVRYDVYLQ